MASKKTPRAKLNVMGVFLELTVLLAIFTLVFVLVETVWRTPFAKSEVARWPSVRGKVIVAEPARNEDEVHHLVYSYTLNDRYYENDDVSAFGVETPDDIKIFPTGSEVTVYYNPDDPREAYLDRTSDDSAWVALVLAAPLTAVLLLWLALLIKRGFDRGDASVKCPDCGSETWSGLQGCRACGCAAGFDPESVNPMLRAGRSAVVPFRIFKRASCGSIFWALASGGCFTGLAVMASAPVLWWFLDGVIFNNETRSTNATVLVLAFGAPILFFVNLIGSIRDENSVS